MRAAKGNATVDYVQSIEPSGTDSVCDLEQEMNSESIQIEISSEDRLRDVVDLETNKNRKLDYNKNDRVYDKKQASESWKEKYFDQMTSNDNKLCTANIQMAELKSYNLLLRNMDLEKSLGLTAPDIAGLRAVISPNLINLPSYLTNFVQEDIVLSSEVLEITEHDL